MSSAVSAVCSNKVPAIRFIFIFFHFRFVCFFSKHVSCAYDHLNGRNSILQATYYVRHMLNKCAGMTCIFKYVSQNGKSSDNIIASLIKTPVQRETLQGGKPNNLIGRPIKAMTSRNAINKFRQHEMIKGLEKYMNPNFHGWGCVLQGTQCRKPHPGYLPGITPQKTSVSYI